MRQTFFEKHKISLGVGGVCLIIEWIGGYQHSNRLYAREMTQRLFQQIKGQKQNQKLDQETFPKQTQKFKQDNSEIHNKIKVETEGS